MVKMNRRAEIKTPMQRGQSLPVMRKIRLQFPVFLVYARQAAENLPCQMGFRAPQRRTGQQVVQLAIVEHPQDVFPLTKAASQLGQQHLAHHVFIADQLHQLIDTVLLQQFLRPLLLQCQTGVVEGEP
ncbi:hypothetical protein D3C78_1032610 [compost metagenome]